MLLPDSSAEFDLTQLSLRERSVLDLASEGRTDEQISRDLAITVSTVNSYWVRIRGKMGQHSRTELVAKTLKAEMAFRLKALQAEKENLAERERQARDALSLIKISLSANPESPWPFLALENLSEATLVVCDPGIITYANEKARLLLRADHAELENLALGDLTPAKHRKIWEEGARALFAESRTRRVALGLDQPLYALRRDGDNFRVLIEATRFDSPEGAMAVVRLREYKADVETLVHTLKATFTLEES